MGKGCFHPIPIAETEKRKRGTNVPRFLFEVEDCVADGLLRVLSVRLLAVTDNLGDDETLAREDARDLAEVEEVFGGQAVEEFLLELGEFLLFALGEAVEGPTQENSCGEPARNGLGVPRAFEVRVFAVFVVTLALVVEPTVLDSEFARQGKFSVEIRAGSTFGVGVGEGALVGLVGGEDSVNLISHNR